jgi:hypothetical protein
MPLPDSIADLARRIEGHGAPSSNTPSYLLYVYPPKQEWNVRRDLNDLRLWLEARNFACVSISLAELMWEALEADGWYESLVSAEREQPCCTSGQSGIDIASPEPLGTGARSLQPLRDQSSPDAEVARRLIGELIESTQPVPV